MFRYLWVTLLVGYESRIGGLDAVATILAELSEKLDAGDGSSASRHLHHDFGNPPNRARDEFLLEPASRICRHDHRKRYPRIGGWPHLSRSMIRFFIAGPPTGKVRVDESLNVNAQAIERPK